MAREYLKKSAVAVKKRRAEVEDTVRRMLTDIAENGDDAIRRFARDLDKWEGDFRVSAAEIEAKSRSLSKVFKEDFEVCHRNVAEFAKRQKESIQAFEVEALSRRRARPAADPHRDRRLLHSGRQVSLDLRRHHERRHGEGGGRRPHHGLRAAALDGIYPQTLYALHKSGADEIYCLGGAQALAAMAMGLVGMRKADLITGPGNPYVAEAKRQLFGIAGIDLLAGPTGSWSSDDTADPSIVATDLLGQAEHGPDSRRGSSRRHASSARPSSARWSASFPTCRRARMRARRGPTSAR